MTKLCGLLGHRSHRDPSLCSGCLNQATLSCDAQSGQSTTILLRRERRFCWKSFHLRPRLMFSPLHRPCALFGFNDRIELINAGFAHGFRAERLPGSSRLKFHLLAHRVHDLALFAFTPDHLYIFFAADGRFLWLQRCLAHAGRNAQQVIFLAHFFRLQVQPSARSRSLCRQ